MQNKVPKLRYGQAEMSFNSFIHFSSSENLCSGQRPWEMCRMEKRSFILVSKQLCFQTQRTRWLHEQEKNLPIRPRCNCVTLQRCCLQRLQEYWAKSFSLHCTPQSQPSDCKHAAHHGAHKGSLQRYNARQADLSSGMCMWRLARELKGKYGNKGSQVSLATRPLCRPYSRTSICARQREAPKTRSKLWWPWSQNLGSCSPKPKKRLRRQM